MSLAAKISALALRVATEFNSLRSQKQDTLVSGTNIKTLNGESLLGSGNMAIEGGGGGLGAPVTVVPTAGTHVIDASLGKYFKLNIAEYTQTIQQLDDITMVGSTQFSLANATSNILNLGVTGQQVGDLIILMVGSDGSMPNIPSGFTEIARVATGTEYAMACYMIATGTTGPTIQLTGHSIATSAISMVFRGVDPNNVFDATTTTAIGATGMPDPPAITTVTEKARVLALGFLDDDNVESSVTAPAGYTIIRKAQTSTTGQTVMCAFKTIETPGTEDPGVFGGSGNDEWVGMTIALRPRWLTIVNELDTYVLITNTPTSEVYEAILEIESTSNKVNFPFEWTWNYPVNFKDNPGMQIRLISDDGGTTFNAIAPVSNNAFAPVLLEEYSKSLTIPAVDIDWKAGAIFHKTITQATTLTFSNIQQGKVITAIIQGNYALNLPGFCKLLSGEYNGTVANYLQFMCISASETTPNVMVTISQQQT